MPILFSSWLTFFRRDEELSCEEKKLSWLVIAIATMLWPVVLPFAYLELMGKLKHSTKAARLHQRMLETNKSQQTA
ncbi:hypothetical protein [Myxacorys almedinensis]|uniref:Uncharacterized protein n=1 Tax=Myxacorys almedinensis A TaxID=2690445 RepID=A0A8J8CHU2_9CYAN|nr:hypothetical protein [Myxacorys almedinensis]NDJ17044.1 hypothetical protein [Myxacorys almedinensis A]